MVVHATVAEAALPLRPPPLVKVVEPGESPLERELPEPQRRKVLGELPAVDVAGVAGHPGFSEVEQKLGEPLLVHRRRVGAFQGAETVARPLFPQAGPVQQMGLQALQPLAKQLFVFESPVTPPLLAWAA